MCQWSAAFFAVAQAFAATCCIQELLDLPHQRLQRAFKPGLCIIVYSRVSALLVLSSLCTLRFTSIPLLEVIFAVNSRSFNNTIINGPSPQSRIHNMKELPTALVATNKRVESSRIGRVSHSSLVSGKDNIEHLPSDFSLMAAPQNPVKPLPV